MNFMIRHLAVILVFATMVVCTWCRGGSTVNSLMPTLPWILAFLFEGMLFFPQRRPYEDAVTARSRVWNSIGKDPLFYFILMFLIVLIVPFFNRGYCLSCDYPVIMKKLVITPGLSAEEAAQPPVPFAPFCVNFMEQFNVLLWFLPALLAALAAKHSLLRSGKRMLVEMIVWNAALLSVLGFIQQGFEAEAPFWIHPKEPLSHFFSVFAYPNRGGAFFVMAFAFSIGAWQCRVAEVAELPNDIKSKTVRNTTLYRCLKAHYMLIASVLIFFGAMCTLSRAALMALFTLAPLAFVYYLASLLFSRRDRVRRVKKAAIALGGGLLFVFMVSVFAPPDFRKEMNTIDSFGVLDRISGKEQYHNALSVRIFKEYPIFGVGGWGYKHFTLNFLNKEEMGSVQRSGGANVHNDYLQFLCEHGIIGSLLLVGIFVLLAAPLFRQWYVLYRAARFMKPENAPPRPRAIFCLPAGTFWILLGNVSLLIHATGDCPMRSASVLSMLFVSLACAEGYIPREITER